VLEVICLIGLLSTGKFDFVTLSINLLERTELHCIEKHLAGFFTVQGKSLSGKISVDGRRAREVEYSGLNQRFQTNGFCNLTLSRKFVVKNASLSNFFSSYLKKKNSE
jgi:hypothetical protein